MATVNRPELETAATGVIRILQGIREFSDARIAVIGGLALWNYHPTGRSTSDVDFIIGISSAPDGVKKKLLALPNSPFFQPAQNFYYKNSVGVDVQIDFTPDWQSPYMPAAAMKLGDLPEGVIPYISQTDLLVFKINSCGLRAKPAKRRIDALDAENVLTSLTAHTTLDLTDKQRDVVEPCIADVVKNGSQTKEWWRERLGLSTES